MEKARCTYNYAAVTLDGNGKRTAHTTSSGQSTNVREHTFFNFRLPRLRKFIGEWPEGYDTPPQTPVSYRDLKIKRRGCHAFARDAWTNTGAAFSLQT